MWKCISTRASVFGMGRGKSSSRLHNIRRWHSSYVFVDNCGICVYCGDVADTEDHFMPLVVAGMIGDLGVKPDGLFLVPSCRDCNIRASHRHFRTVETKRNFIQERLRRKHRRLLNSPVWESEEMAELGYNLSVAINAAEAKREWITKRLAWENAQNPNAAAIAAIRSNCIDIGKNFVRRVVDQAITATSESKPLLLSGGGKNPQGSSGL